MKNKKEKLFGFGHRVYRNFDPRAKIIKDVAENEVFPLVGVDPLIEIAKALQVRGGGRGWGWGWGYIKSDRVWTGEVHSVDCAGWCSHHTAPATRRHLTCNPAPRRTRRCRTSTS